MLILRLTTDKVKSPLRFFRIYPMADSTCLEVPF